MRIILNRLHAKLGDFWWYSLILFIACRAADLLNAFVGLWLVPKYVPPSELGAVMPLMNFANFLAIPITAFANTFRNELSRLSVAKEFGQLKTLMRGVFIASAIFLFLAIIIANFIMPAFLERIRIAEGSLSLIIIAASFVSAVAPIYSCSLQALKKFKEQSIISILSAPVRFITMLITMPFRAISGYFIGQASVPVFSMAASVIALKKQLSVKAVPYWNKHFIRQFSKIFIIFLISGLIGGINVITESTIIRQRLPDLDSAAYYMATRFSEIANFLACTLAFTIFPFTAEKAAKGESLKPLILKSIAANACFCLLIALPFLFCGKWLLSIMPNGQLYSAYWWVIPWLIGLTLISSIIVLYTTSEISANRFGYLKWYLPLDIIYPLMLLLVTGHEYFSEIIPETFTNFLNTNNIYSLKTMLFWMTCNILVKAIVCSVALIRQKVK